MNALEEIEHQLAESVAARAQAEPERLPRLEGTAGHPWAAASRPWLRRRSAQIALAFALPGTLVAVGLASLNVTPGAAPAAAAALHRLALIAASGPSLVPGPGQYLYVSSVSDSPATDGTSGCVSSAVDHRQVWVAADGSGLLRESGETPTFTSAADQALCQKSDPTLSSASGPASTWFAGGCFSLGPTDTMQSVSTDPNTLLAQMRTIDGGPNTPTEDFVHVGDFLRETDASPAVRAALYRAAALIPGVRLLGTVQDHLGRQGLGVALTSGGNLRSELIFNRQTAALMGEESAGSSPGSSSWAVYLASTVVDSLPEPSPVPLSPPCVHTAGHVQHVQGTTVITGAEPAEAQP
jgi:hypothetical protein